MKAESERRGEEGELKKKSFSFKYNGIVTNDFFFLFFFFVALETSPVVCFLVFSVLNTKNFEFSSLNTSPLIIVDSLSKCIM